MLIINHYYTEHNVSGKEALIELRGVVIEVLPSGLFKIKLEDETGHIITGHLSGKLRKHRIRILLGDRVDVEMTPYDLNKGRIKYRIG